MKWSQYIGLIAKRSREGSVLTRNNRYIQLRAVGKDLEEMGLKNRTPYNLKNIDVKFLIARWIGQRRSPGTIQNKVSNLRWLMRKVNRSSVIKSNKSLGVPGHTGRRKYV